MLRAIASANLTSPGPIGATTPGSIAATTITASNTITPDPVFGIVGSPTNNNAQTGSVGEYVSAVALYPGGAISVSTGTVSTITSITLTAGDWDVQASTMARPPLLPPEPRPSSGLRQPWRLQPDRK